MFKSVFARYMIAFMTIILISFTVLALIISSIVSSYMTDTTDKDLDRIAQTARFLIREDYHEGGYEDFDSYFVGEEDKIRQYISAVTYYTEDKYVILTDETGKVLCTADSLSEGYVQKDLPAEVVDKVISDELLKDNSDLGGVFAENHYCYAIPLADDDGQVQCLILACSPSTYTDEVVGSLVRMVLMASMWVMIAAIIASYFISERIVRPIRMVSRAAKAFAAGHFDVRVPVIGDGEVSELAMAFNNMASSLATLENTRSTFLANVSHDLRTPMTIISGYIDGILDGAIPPEKQTHYLSIIASEVRRLSRLVSSLLDISRIEAGERKFNMQPFDICEMARQILISFESRIEEKKLDVGFDCDEDKMMVMGDSDAIHQILYNLCDNGVKFSREGGKYAIRITEKDKKVYVSVFDEGEGISPEDLPHIFDRFYKGDKSRGKDKTGVGLGMYIAKTIIDAHGETITVNSKYGENCEFVFTLKKAKAEK